MRRAVENGLWNAEAAGHLVSSDRKTAATIITEFVMNQPLTARRKSRVGLVLGNAIGFVLVACLLVMAIGVARALARWALGL